MNFEIKDFINNLPPQITRQELATLIYEEIRAAENMKVGYLDQATENPQFYVTITRQLDNYINNMKVLHNTLSPTVMALDQEVYSSEQTDLDQIMELAKRIEKMERDRFPKG
ncbi:hypothetical protein JAO76_08740 [Pontibacter sp. BT310]|jgi:hypothetical protein|uniref:Uncharacterized protein n=1 Tax=Pontibacter populi TaxID=890055 RepID=A0ABS6XAV6_9BACT|nr:MULTISPECIES: hypothetical protein [Pontibacter]MBJ6118275.1 hypothetical protein [Pontibacter sp. BT310]MBR0570702.1 hypothetical protein [Microvirga sp. STS03]MBW3365128.1 hypothetical protein [Pontibacter populi]